jgi:mycothiol synthase
VSPHGSRPASEEDLAAITDLVVACDVAQIGVEDTNADDVRSVWLMSGVDLGADSRVLLDGDRLIGYAVLWGDEQRTELEGWLSVHPSVSGDAAVRELLGFLESRAAAVAADAGATFGLTEAANDTRRGALLTAAGYADERHFWRMRRDLGPDLPPPAWPAGVAVRPFEPGRDERGVHAVREEAFARHWHFRASDFETWAARTVGRSDFDPRLCFLVTDGGETVAVLLGYSYDELAWIQTVAVRPAWRGQGLALAMLHHAFAVYRDSGHIRVELEVDAANTTGATRLYERAGMTVDDDHSYVFYAKPVGGPRRQSG